MKAQKELLKKHEYRLRVGDSIRLRVGHRFLRDHPELIQKYNVNYSMGVIAEGMAALVLAEAFLEKFGGDSLAETRRNYDGYLSYLQSRISG